MTLFGNTVFRGNQVKTRLRWALILHDWCPYLKKETEGDHHMKIGGRDRVTATCQEYLGLPEARKRQGRTPLQV